MCFSKYVFIALVIFIAVIAIFVFKLIIPGEQDALTYQKLVESQDPNHLEKTAHPYKAKQERELLQKDILFSQKNERLQIRLLSERGELVLDHHDDKTELIEHMNDVKCYMQEEIFYILPDGREALLQEDGRLLVKHADPQEPGSWSSPEGVGVKPMQMIRYMEAATATYYYENNLFTAENVIISRYLVSGHWLSEFDPSSKPMMSGIAESVQFNLSGKGFNFKAHQLKAKFYQSRG